MDIKEQIKEQLKEQLKEKFKVKIELLREEIKKLMLEILDMFELEEAKDKSEAEYIFMMNQYNLYKFIDAKSESLIEDTDKVRGNHIEELKRDPRYYNFKTPYIYKFILVAPKLQGVPKGILYNL